MNGTWLSRGKFMLFGLLMLLLVFVLAGCEGDTGPAGPAGAPGADAPTVSVAISDLTADEIANLTMTGNVTSVTIASPPAVNFWVKDQFGRGISGLGELSGTSLAFWFG